MASVAQCTLLRGSDPWSPGTRDPVFLFFSNRLGCLGSLALSLLLTVVVLLALHVL
jgi:hypothetical protein